ncbi:hypothetical protein L195_g056614 [Trifolium pratense]|uniref:Uncharacterized protein n=1 Tax=Trifolium pratense TaxID=57577 RepID=A0A2K3KSJ1_TRIPR|nr:hypothetical protein L195_g056614 [Trifolium pratense]
MNVLQRKKGSEKDTLTNTAAWEKLLDIIGSEDAAA